MTSREATNSEWKGRYETLEKSHQELRTDLLRQEKVTNEVRQEATGFLSQMKALSERSTQSLEHEERLVMRVQRLEGDLREWKNRYTRLKTQASTARASSMAMSIGKPDAAGLSKDGSLASEDGWIKDVHLTRFQIAIDELLRSARSEEPKSVLPHVKSVVVAVRNISLDLGDTESSTDDATERRRKLKAKVSATANNLITAAKNFAMSHGLSPVSLLDAAASHLSASIVELARMVKVRPSPAEELDDDGDGNSDIVDSPADYYGIINDQLGASRMSTQSTNSIPQLKQRAFSGSNQRKPVPSGLPYNAPQKQVPSHSSTRDSRIEELKVWLLGAMTKDGDANPQPCRISSTRGPTRFSQRYRAWSHPSVRRRHHRTSSILSSR